SEVLLPLPSYTLTALPSDLGHWAPRREANSSHTWRPCCSWLHPTPQHHHPSAHQIHVL
ncbi:hypothetical protein P7K49_040374, partial [Saguinus oedipus]